MKHIARFLAVALLGAQSLAHAADESLRITLDTPASGSAARGVQGTGFLAGRVRGMPGEPDLTDLMFVIDVSDSTSLASGGDIDGDGKARGRWQQIPIIGYLGRSIGFGQWLDQGDSVLAAEITAARGLLDQLDPRSTRVGAITFSGDARGRTLDATVIAPLTSDYAEVRRALDAELATGPNGRTNMLAGISLATVELAGTRSARSVPRAGARKLALLFSDGLPTLPFNANTTKNAELAVDAAVRAARSGIRIRTYGVGAQADEDCLREVARVAQGTYTPVIQPSELRAEVARVDFVDAGEIEIENLASGERARRIARTPDGRFFALLPMQPGQNPIQITAGPQTARAQSRFEVEFREDAEVADGTPEDPTHARMRSSLFESWLAPTDATP
jgi:hypothetical protein